MSSDFIKYPRTPHLVGSRLQPGDDASGQIPVGDLTDGILVIEEKIDGANAGISFDADGRLMLQSRGHPLAGGPREAQFALLKAWAQTIEPDLREVLGRRYIVYGEWCFAKHTVFYDRLPHYFLEFDVFDRETGRFLSTPARRALLEGLPIVSVPVLHEGRVATRKALEALIAPSLYKSDDWEVALAAAASETGQDPARVARETDRSRRSEGLYVKQEQDDRVIGRYKFVRADFLQAILASGSHWADRPIVANRLAPGVDLFGGLA